MELELLQQILGKLTSVETDIKELKTDVAELKTDVAELKTDVAELKTDVLDLQNEVAKLKFGQAEIRKQQQKDSGLLQSVFDQVAHLTEHEYIINDKFQKIKAIL